MEKIEPKYKEKILVVDDEEPVARVLRVLLEQGGYEVCWASGFAEVQRYIAEDTFALMTLDVMMPDASGLEVLAWIKERCPDIGVVMATALGDVDTVIEAMRLGAYSYVVKPFNLDLVEAEVARVMERQRLVAENRAYQHRLEQKVEEQTRDLRVAYTRLERQVKELRGRDQLVHLQSSGAGMEEAAEGILQVVQEVLGAERAVLYWATDGQLEPLAGLGVVEEGRIVDAEALGAVPLVAPLDAMARTLEQQQPQDGDAAGIAVPLLHQEEALGVMWVADLNVEDRQEGLNVLWRLGREAAQVLWTTRLAQGLEMGEIEVDELLKLK
jgi:DNA-binding response OmpR family regulator